MRRYRRELLAYCRRVGSVGTNAEDTLQQALLQAWSAIRTGVEVRDPRAWLYRIVHNVAVSNQRRPVVLPVEVRDTAGANGADHVAEQRMAARDALAGLAALPDLQREVMVGTAVDGMSHEELASALGLSSGAVRGLIYRARATLRAAAAAITPGPLISWALRSGSGPGSGFYEALAGGGTAGIGGILVKGGAIAVTAGAIATATGISTSHKAVHHRATPTAAAARRHVIGRPAAASVASSRLLVTDPTSSHVSTGRRPAPQQGTPESSGRGSGKDHGFASVIAKRGPTERHGDGSGSSGTGDAPSGHDGSHRGSGSGKGSSDDGPATVGGSDGSNAGTGSTTVTGGIRQRRPWRRDLGEGRRNLRWHPGKRGLVVKRRADDRNDGLVGRRRQRWRRVGPRRRHHHHDDHVKRRRLVGLRTARRDLALDPEDRDQPLLVLGVDPRGYLDVLLQARAAQLGRQQLVHLEDPRAV